MTPQITYLKFIYSEKATKFCEIFTLLFTGIKYIGQKQGEDIAKFCGLLRIYMNFTIPKIKMFFRIEFLNICYFTLAFKYPCLQ